MKELTDKLRKVNPPTLDANIQNTMIQALNDKDEDVRSSAVSILSYSSDLSIIPFLQKLVDTEQVLNPKWIQLSIDNIKNSHYNHSRSFEELKADIFKSSASINAIETFYRFHKNDPRTIDTLMEIARGRIGHQTLQVYAVKNLHSIYSLKKDHESELYQISRSLLFNKNLSANDREKMLILIARSSYRDNNDFSDFFEIINDPQESFNMKVLTISTLIDLHKFYPTEGIELLKKLKDKFETEENVDLLNYVMNGLKDLEEKQTNIRGDGIRRLAEEIALKKIINDIDIKTDTAACLDRTEETSKIESTAGDVKSIAAFVDSKDDSLAIQKLEDTSQMYLEAEEIEKQLRNAVERLETATIAYQVAVEPIEKEIIRLQNEINGHLPFTFKKLVTEVAEVFGYNEFGTHESRQRNIEKKRFEIRKKEREILDPAIEELKTAYNDGVQFFNSYPSIQEKKFSSINLNEWELPVRSQGILSEFSKLHQQKQNHD